MNGADDSTFGKWWSTDLSRLFSALVQISRGTTDLKRDPLIYGQDWCSTPMCVVLRGFQPRGFSVPSGHCGHLEILFRSTITSSAAAHWRWEERREAEGAGHPCGHPGSHQTKMPSSPI